MTTPISVLLTTEGTYPYHSGGVSTWCDNLVKGLPALEFTLLPIMMNPHISVKYDLPRNVVRVIDVPLWGTEEPAEFIRDIPFSHIYLSKQRTRRGVIGRQFLPLLTTLVRQIYADQPDPQVAGETLYDMYRYFRQFDYNATFKSREVWEGFAEEVLVHASVRPGAPFPSLFEVTEGLRWLYRFLIPLNAEPPRTHVTHSTAAAFCGLPCIVAKLRDGTPFLLTEHGVYVREQYLAISRMKISHAAKEFLLNLIVLVSRVNYHFADQISPVCHYNKRWELAHGAAAAKIRVIHNGVNPELFVPREVHRERATVVVSAARIDPLKDIETLIRAAAVVRREQPDVRFVVYGSMVNEAYYRECLDLRGALGLDDTVSFPGHTASPWEVYNQGDIVALTSISEAFPYSVIEAMACGRPVVASDVGGVREALEGCGLLVRPREPEAFGESILGLLRDRDSRFQMGQEARDRILNTFTLDRFIREYRDSYRELAP